MIVDILASFLGVILFLFLFWKRLKEDYAPEIIFKSAFTILLGIGVGIGLSLKFIPEGFFWLGFLGAISGLGFISSRFRMRFYEVFDALTIAVLPWLSFIFLKNSVINSSLSSFIAFLAVLVIIFFYYFFDQHYKDFTWYKSGKIGFAGLATFSIIFLLRAGIALAKAPVLSFLSLKYEAILSGAMAFICFILIYNLGRKKE